MWNSALPIPVAVTLLEAAGPPAQPARRVAITNDDGPAVGEMEDLVRFQRISNGPIAPQSDGPSADWREREFSIPDLTWRALDITRIVEGRASEGPDPRCSL